VFGCTGSSACRGFVVKCGFKRYRTGRKYTDLRYGWVCDVTLLFCYYHPFILALISILIKILLENEKNLIDWCRDQDYEWFVNKLWSMLMDMIAANVSLMDIPCYHAVTFDADEWPMFCRRLMMDMWSLPAWYMEQYNVIRNKIMFKRTRSLSNAICNTHKIFLSQYTWMT